MITSALSSLVVSDSPDFRILIVWLAIGVVGFLAGALLVRASLRRTQQRPVATMQRDSAAAPSELIAA